MKGGLLVSSLLPPTPVSLDHERYLIGALMMQHRKLLEAEELVRPEHFATPMLARVYSAMLALAAEGIQPEPIAIEDRLAPGALDDYGGRAYLASLITECPVYTNWRYYAQQVRDDAERRAVQQACERILAQESASGERMKALLLEEAVQVGEPLRPSAVTLAESVKKWEKLDEAEPANLLRYPWPFMQEATRGMWPGWLCVLAGEPGHGKTAAALLIAQFLAAQNKRILINSLEMSPQEILIRMFQRHLPIRVLRGKVEASQAELEQFAALRADGRFQRIIVGYEPRPERFAALLQRYKPDLFILDHLQLLPLGENRYQAVTEATGYLKRLAEEYQIPILALSQLNRAKGEEASHPPRLYRLRDSGSIEADANTVVFVWRECKEEVLLDEGAFVVAKSRMGHTTRANFRFDGDHQTFKLEGEPGHGV